MSPNKQQDAESQSDILDREDSEVQVTLDWLQRKFGCFLEIFLMIQFGAGVCLFFTGIFFLVWAVAPTASLQAGSYMLLAFFIIGRALLGIIGYYTKNFCLLFSYGVILLATFVLRTIMIMVRLKIMVSPDHHFSIPPLLQAAPGAMPTYIEMTCAILECLQVFCSFYLCWILSKKLSLEKKEDESKLTLSIANEVARYLHQKESSSINRNNNNIDSKECVDERENQIKTAKQNELTISDKRRKSLCVDVMMRKQSIPEFKQQNQRINTNINSSNANNINNSTMMPLKSILHQPAVTTAFINQQTSTITATTTTIIMNRRESTHTTQTHHFHTQQQQYHHHCPAKYDNLPHQHTNVHHNSNQIIHAHYHNIGPHSSLHQFCGYQNYPNIYFNTQLYNHTNIEHEYFQPPQEDDEDKELPVLGAESEDYHNNNHRRYGRITPPPRPPPSKNNQRCFYPNNIHRSSFDYSPDEDEIIDENLHDYMDVEPPPRQPTRARSPIQQPIGEEDQQFNFPLLYERVNNVYQNYGATTNYYHARNDFNNIYHRHNQ